MSESMKLFARAVPKMVQATEAFNRMSTAFNGMNVVLFPVRQIVFDLKHRERWERAVDRAYFSFMRYAKQKKVNT